MDLIRTIEEQQKKPQIPDFRVGDTVKVYFEIIEGKTKRIQVYEGLVLCFKNSGIRRTFTVRKESYGVGVERIFPVHSPRVMRVEIVRPGKVRRAKLYYIRDKVGRAAKVKEPFTPKVAQRVAAANALSKEIAAKQEALLAQIKADTAAEAAANKSKGKKK